VCLKALHSRRLRATFSGRTPPFTRSNTPPARESARNSVFPRRLTDGRPFKELALRLSLGATRGRIVRQLLAEHLALGILGALAGAAVAFGLFDVLVKILPSNTPRLAQARLDLTTVLLTLALGAATSLVFGLVPALQISKPDLQDSLKEGGRTLAAPSRSLFGSALVIGEVALAIVLLVGAGLLVRSFVELQNVSPGFDPRGTLTARLSLPAERYQSSASVVRFYDSLIERLRTVPGVTSASATTQLPLDSAGGSMGAFTKDVPGRASGTGKTGPSSSTEASLPATAQAWAFGWSTVAI
jgi:putative ABC transport system permease protein